MAEVLPSSPDWSCLYETAASQEGLFTTRQAAEAGYSPQLLVHHVHSGRVLRLRRGIYRLWSERAGVVSHQTALGLHGLSDALPAHVHLTLPGAWSRRRLRVPGGVVLHHADVSAEERAWFGPVPTTNVRRTLNDCARAELSPELLRPAARQALRRGLVTRAELGDVEAALEPFGGLAA